MCVLFEFELGLLNVTCSSYVDRIDMPLHMLNRGVLQCFMYGNILETMYCGMKVCFYVDHAMLVFIVLIW